LVCCVSQQQVRWPNFPRMRSDLPRRGSALVPGRSAWGTRTRGVASDFSAIYWNPAGLAQLVHGEFSLGLNYNDQPGQQVRSSGTRNLTRQNATNLNTFGVVYRCRCSVEMPPLAFGFTRQNSFLTGMSFKGFNPNSTIAQWYAPRWWYDPNDPSYNLAYMLYLATQMRRDSMSARSKTD